MRRSLNLPQMRLPTSKINMDIKKDVFRGKYLYTFPHVDWNEAKVRKKAEPYQPTTSSPWNWSVILGIAVATIVCKQNQKKEPVRKKIDLSTTPIWKWGTKKMKKGWGGGRKGKQ